MTRCDVVVASVQENPTKNKRKFDSKCETGTLKSILKQKRFRRGPRRYGDTNKGILEAVSLTFGLFCMQEQWNCHKKKHRTGLG